MFRLFQCILVPQRKHLERELCQMYDCNIVSFKKFSVYSGLYSVFNLNVVNSPAKVQ